MKIPITRHIFLFSHFTWLIIFTQAIHNNPREKVSNQKKNTCVRNKGILNVLDAIKTAWAICQGSEKRKRGKRKKRKKKVYTSIKEKHMVREVRMFIEREKAHSDD